MTEKEGAAQQVAELEERQEPQERSESVPEQEIPEEALKGYEGKSPEELAKMHYGLSQKLGEQGQVIGSLKELVEELRAGREKQAEIPNPFQSEYQEQREVAPEVSSVERMSDDDYLTVGQVKELLGTREEKAKQQQYQELVVKTSTAFDRGRDSMKNNPRLFDGIENEVAQRVAQSYIGPFKMFGMDVSGELQNPARWEQAAKYIRLERNEFDRLMPEKSPAVPATATETPSSVNPYRSDSPPIELDTRDPEIQAFEAALEREYVDLGVDRGKRDIEKTVKAGAEVDHISFEEANRLWRNK